MNDLDFNKLKLQFANIICSVIGWIESLENFEFVTIQQSQFSKNPNWLKVYLQNVLL